MPGNTQGAGQRHVKGGSTDTRVEGEVELERTRERTKGSSVLYPSPARPSRDGLLGGGIADGNSANV